VCRTFAIKRSTLIDSLARIGWSAGAYVTRVVEAAANSLKMLKQAYAFVGYQLLKRLAWPQRLADPRSLDGVADVVVVMPDHGL
jgi:hypothetical protein